MAIAFNQKILLEDGSYKNVEEIAEGDIIRCWNFDEGHIDNKPVFIYHIQNAPAGHIFVFHFTDGTSLELHGNHSIYSDDYECFIHSMDLDVGDTVRGIDGPKTIESIDYTHTDDPDNRQVYITTEDCLCYYVNDVLCGNQFCNNYTIENMQYIKDNRTLNNFDEVIAPLAKEIEGESTIPAFQKIWDGFRLAESIESYAALRFYITKHIIFLEMFPYMYEEASN